MYLYIGCVSFFLLYLQIKMSTHVISFGEQDLLIPSLMDHGIKFSSTTLSMVPGTPIKPMLAKYFCCCCHNYFKFEDIHTCNTLYCLLCFCDRITNGIPQVLKLFSCKAFSCEYKYAVFFSL